MPVALLNVKAVLDILERRVNRLKWATVCADNDNDIKSFNKSSRKLKIKPKLVAKNKNLAVNRYIQPNEASKKSSLTVKKNVRFWADTYGLELRLLG